MAWEMVLRGVEEGGPGEAVTAPPVTVGTRVIAGVKERLGVKKEVGEMDKVAQLLALALTLPWPPGERDGEDEDSGVLLARGVVEAMERVGMEEAAEEREEKEEEDGKAVPETLPPNTDSEGKGEVEGTGVKEFSEAEAVPLAAEEAVPAPPWEEADPLGVKVPSSKEVRVGVLPAEKEGTRDGVAPSNALEDDPVGVAWEVGDMG